MKILVAGVQRMYGKSNAGSEFDICNLLALTPIEPFNNGKMQRLGYGLAVTEIPLAQEALVQFKDQKFPVLLEVVTEPRPRNGKFETVVVGLAAPLAKAA